MNRKLVIPSSCWEATWSGLEKRSDSTRESACIWAGRREKEVWSVEKVIYLDDLPGVRGYALRHSVPPEASAELFKILRSHKLQIIADVHCHPEDWVDLSWVDQQHPIEYRVGLIAVVLPWYAASTPSLMETGFHEYLGDLKWRRLETEEKEKRILIKNEESKL